MSSSCCCTSAMRTRDPRPRRHSCVSKIDRAVGNVDIAACVRARSRSRSPKRALTGVVASRRGSHCAKIDTTPCAPRRADRFEQKLRRKLHDNDASGALIHFLIMRPHPPPKTYGTIDAGSETRVSQADRRTSLHAHACSLASIRLEHSRRVSIGSATPHSQVALVRLRRRAVLAEGR